MNPIQNAFDEGKVMYFIEDWSDYMDHYPIGYINALIKTEISSLPKARMIRDWHEFEIVFKYDLVNYRIYREGYLDKIMVSGLDRNGNRVQIFLDKRLKTGKKKRNRWFPARQR